MSEAQERARDLGIPFDGQPGPLNAITDVPGVEVGHSTIIRGDGPLKVGEGPVRTGVTAIFPLGKEGPEGVFAGWFALNGAGEMTGSVVLSEFGELHGPVLLTNTVSVGTVQAATIEWNRQRIDDENAVYARASPVVAETWDGHLNDIYGQHVKEKHVFEALDGASSGPVVEGSVGGGTGMTAYRLKAGIGTSSRKVKTRQGDFNLGVLVQANFGLLEHLIIAGVPVGRELMANRVSERPGRTEGRSVIIVVATDAPLLPVQLDRIARRASLGLARDGSIATDGSGDIFLAFSTASKVRAGETEMRQIKMLTDIDPLFEGTVQATEEAVINALVAADEMTGRDGHHVPALPKDKVRDLLQRYNRLVE